MTGGRREEKSRSARTPTQAGEKEEAGIARCRRDKWEREGTLSAEKVEKDREKESVLPKEREGRHRGGGPNSGGGSCPRLRS